MRNDLCSLRSYHNRSSCARSHHSLDRTNHRHCSMDMHCRGHIVPLILLPGKLDIGHQDSLCCHIYHHHAMMYLHYLRVEVDVGLHYLGVEVDVGHDGHRVYWSHRCRFAVTVTMQCRGDHSLLPVGRMVCIVQTCGSRLGAASTVVQLASHMGCRQY